MQQWEEYRQKSEPELCSFCGSENTHMWVGDPDEPGPDELLLCLGCYGWSQCMMIGTAR